MLLTNEDNDNAGQQLIVVGSTLSLTGAFAATGIIHKIAGEEFGLAPVVVDEVFDAIAATGVGVLLVEQDVERALTASSRGYLLIEGRIAATGTAQHLRETDEVRQRVLGM